MEDVLEVYQRPHDPQRPLVCLALDQEPLKAAYPCRSSQASLHSVNASPSAEPPQLGKLRYLLFATSTWCALNPSMKLPFVCLAAHGSELHR